MIIFLLEMENDAGESDAQVGQVVYTNVRATQNLGLCLAGVKRLSRSLDQAWIQKRGGIAHVLHPSKTGP